mgnify:CR=1 FL=1
MLGVYSRQCRVVGLLALFTFTLNYINNYFAFFFSTSYVCPDRWDWKTPYLTLPNLSLTPLAGKMGHARAIAGQGVQCYE